MPSLFSGWMACKWSLPRFTFVLVCEYVRSFLKWLFTVFYVVFGCSCDCIFSFVSICQVIG